MCPQNNDRDILRRPCLDLSGSNCDRAIQGPWHMFTHWPSDSPDRNPIENLWDVLEKTSSSVQDPGEKWMKLWTKMIIVSCIVCQTDASFVCVRSRQVQSEKWSNTTSEISDMNRVVGKFVSVWPRKKELWLEFTGTLTFSVCFTPTGLPSRAGEVRSLTAACSLSEVCQILDLSSPSDATRGWPGCPAHVWGGCSCCVGGKTSMTWRVVCRS